MRAGVAAVIFDVVINLAKNIIQTKNNLYVTLMLITFIITYVFGISAMTVIMLCVVVGIVNLLIDIKNHKKQVSGEVK